jgi:hypothetical protein
MTIMTRKRRLHGKGAKGSIIIKNRLEGIVSPPPHQQQNLATKASFDSYNLLRTYVGFRPNGNFPLDGV